MICQQLLRSVPRGSYDDIVNVDIHAWEVPQDPLHHPLEDDTRIFQSHGEHGPLFRASRGRHACDMPILLFQRNLVVPVLHVEDRPNFELPLVQQDVLNPRQG